MVNTGWHPKGIVLLQWQQKQIRAQCCPHASYFGGKFKRLRVDWDTWSTDLGVKFKGKQKQISVLFGKLKMEAKKKNWTKYLIDSFCLRLQYSSIYHCFWSYLYLKCWPFIYHAYIWMFKTLVLMFKYCIKISFILPTGLWVLPGKCFYYSPGEHLLKKEKKWVGT